MNPYTPPKSDPNLPPKKTYGRIMRAVFFVLGCLFFALGIVGIFLPVLPTTPFMILTAGCWANSSERFHNWLIHHPQFGEFIQNWQEKRAIPRRAKYFAWTMMTISCGMLFYRLPNHLWVAIVTSVICFCTMIWMARLPDD